MLPRPSRSTLFPYTTLFRSRPEVRPIWEMMPLSLHEAVPGHHFQFARSLELPDAPMFRKTAYFVAYSEGWGLYAEQLGFDMRSEEHTSVLQSQSNLVCRLLL